MGPAVPRRSSHHDDKPRWIGPVGSETTYVRGRDARGYCWLLQTDLTKARRKSITQMLGEHQDELKKQQGPSKWRWARRDLLRGFPFRWH
jgi:hypothetical protein